MSSKTLIRTGSSLVKRLFLTNPVLHQQKPNLSGRYACHGLETIAPQLFPSLSGSWTSLHLPQDDRVCVSKLSNQGFLHPAGLPSLRFLLPDGIPHIYSHSAFSFRLISCKNVGIFLLQYMRASRLVCFVFDVLGFHVF